MHLFSFSFVLLGKFICQLFRPSFSLDPLPTSCQFSGVLPSTEPQGSERSVGEAVAEETRFPGEGAAVGLVASEVTTAMVVGSSEGLALTSREIASVVPSSPRPASPSPSLTSGGLPFADEVVQQFDATHRLSELTAAWGSLSTLATSFGEKLQVSFSATPPLDARFSSVLMPCFSLSLLAQSFSRDHSDFFFSSKNEKKLSSEVSTLKAELDICRAELETKRQTH